MLEVKANHAIFSATKSLERKKLILAPHKSKAVLLVARHRVKKVIIDIDGVNIASHPKIFRCLRNMTMKYHIYRTVERANKVINAIIRIMPNIGGPRGNSRRMLSPVSQSVMLYATSIWNNALSKKIYRSLYVKVPYA